MRRTRSSRTPPASSRSSRSAPTGRFTYPVTDYEGLHVFDANLPIIDHLKARTRGEGDHGAVTAGTVLLRRETYDHAYPHCWRCREPLIYMAVSCWFVEVTKIKERMLELNEEIAWTPDHIKHGQFGKWLENARDWSITRNRFWGSPIPCGSPTTRSTRGSTSTARSRSSSVTSAWRSPTSTGRSSTG